jgi:hypothetical protein
MSATSHTGLKGGTRHGFRLILGPCIGFLNKKNVGYYMPSIYYNAIGYCSDQSNDENPADAAEQLSREINFVIQ